MSAQEVSPGKLCGGELRLPAMLVEINCEEREEERAGRENGNQWGWGISGDLLEGWNGEGYRESMEVTVTDSHQQGK